jgi:hypothetical protein
MASPWSVVEKRPYSRGVTQLMYVGDDEAVENATSSSRYAATLYKVGIAAAVVGIATGKKTVRNIGAALAIAGALAR